MTTAKEYREFANECLRWAAEVKADDDRQAFLDMAKVWTQLAMHGNEAQGPSMSVAAE